MTTQIVHGWIVSWTSPTTPVGINEVRMALAKCGFDPELAKDMAPRNAFTRATKEMSKGRIIRKVDSEGDDITFQFTKEALVGTEFEYTKEATLFLNKETGSVSCPDDYQLGLHAEQLVRHHIGIRIAGDITRLVQKIFESFSADLVPIRPQGGVYFVPSHHQAVVDSVESMLTAIGGALNRFIIGDEQSTRDSIANKMTEHLLGMIEELRESVKTISADTKQGVLDRRLNSANEIRNKLSAYSGLLAGYVTSIEAELKLAEDEFVSAITREAVAA